MIHKLDMAVWDINSQRGVTFKEQLDMFTAEGREVKLYALDIKDAPLHDVFFLSFDECSEPVLKTAKTVRSAGETTFILIVSDRSRDVTPCFRPKIRPCGVLFRPVQNRQIKEMLTEIAEETERLTDGGGDDAFVFKSEGASHRVSFRDILFFEASNKKIRLRTAGQEICYYDSMEKLCSVLPPYFIRCHRGFVVNTHKIVELRGADMELKLTGGSRIPFSRSCREAVSLAIRGQTAERTG